MDSWTRLVEQKSSLRTSAEESGSETLPVSFQTRKPRSCQQPSEKNKREATVGGSQHCEKQGRKMTESAILSWGIKSCWNFALILTCLVRWAKAASLLFQQDCCGLGPSVHPSSPGNAGTCVSRLKKGLSSGLDSALWDLQCFCRLCSSDLKCLLFASGLSLLSLSHPLFAEARTQMDCVLGASQKSAAHSVS